MYPWAIPFSVTAMPGRRKPTRGPVHRHRPVIDAASRSLDPVDRRTSDIIRIGCEMRGIQLPERLHGDVESAAAQRAKALRLGEHDAEVMGCRIQPARPIEGGDLGIRQMQAEDPLETRDLVQAAGDHTAHRGVVGMGEQQPRLGAERAAAPLEHRRPLAPRCPRAGTASRPRRRSR